MMLKLVNRSKKLLLILGLPLILTTLTTPKAMSQLPSNFSEEEWIDINCEGEPSITLTPDKQEKIKAALSENKQLQNLLGELAAQEFSANLLDGFLAMAHYSLGEFRRQSEGTSLGLLSLFFDEKTLETLSNEVRSQWEKEMEKACLNQSTEEEYIWKKP